LGQREGGSDDGLSVHVRNTAIMLGMNVDPPLHLR
jgi:hypothetical protein